MVYDLQEVPIMSKRNKLEKFAELLSFPNVFENFDAKAPSLVGENGMPVDMKGVWKTKCFQHPSPITLELACGRGEYSLALAKAYPQRNFIGVDIKGARIWKGASIALESGLTNVAFLRTRIEQITHFFEKGEIEEIWITFPDPFLKKSKANRRLTAPSFLDRYRQILNPGGIVHLKTDNPELYEFTLETLSEYEAATLLVHQDDIYQQTTLLMPELAYKTYYEGQHLAIGRKIKYVRFRID